MSVAVRVDAPLFAVADVLEEAGVHISDETDEDEIAKFREFLEDIDPDDFAAGRDQ